jgi:hypothetical protein
MGVLPLDDVDRLPVGLALGGPNVGEEAGVDGGDADGGPLQLGVFV